MSKLYDPFSTFSFDNNVCFLSGKTLQSSDEEMQVFPTWLMQMFDLEAKPFKMLDEQILTYKQLKIPCAASTAERIDHLENQVQQAFTNGYAAVSQMDQVTLFQWVAKLVYGIVFNEVRAGIRQQQATGEPLNFSQVLAKKFKNLHLMLQSLLLEMQFEGRNPFKIVVFPVDNPDDTFIYRDEINTLVFSLRMRDFAIIATLQDNGTNVIYHEDVLKHVQSHVLHPIQFEEICARFFYSTYLFSRLPEYTVAETPQRIFVEPMSLLDMHTQPLFDYWDNKVYGQVLENFWKPWGLTLFEIIKNPEHPVSFLYDQEGLFLEASAIDHPKS